jgi:hypothetical protein
MQRPLATAGSTNCAPGSPTGPCDVFSTYPTGIAYPFDGHMSWNQVDLSDSYPVFYGTEKPYTAPNTGQVCGMMSISGTTGTWITGHQFNTGWTGSIDANGAAQTIFSVGSATSMTFSAPPGNTSATPFCHNPVSAAWSNELLGIVLSTGKAYRFSHIFSTGTDARYFDDADAICTVSQNGDVAYCTTSYLGNFGSNAGASSCISTLTCRSDVIAVQLH